MYNVKLPYSKSLLIRLMILGSQLKDKLVITGYTPSGDVLTVQSALEKLGCLFSVENNALTISPPAELQRSAAFYIKDSAAGFRMLLGLLAAIPGGEYILEVSEQLKKRPYLPLVEALNASGARISATEFPQMIKGRQLTNTISLDTTLSSQYFSALLLAAPQQAEGMEVIISGGQVSWGYAEMTLKLLADFGIKINRTGNKYFISGRLINPGKYAVEVDYSAASYFWAMAASGGIAVFVPGNRNTSSQGDAAFAEVLRLMGAEVKNTEAGCIVSKGRLTGINADMKQMPDQVLTLGVLGLLAESPVKITNIAHVQHKESRRISCLLEEIERIGGKAEYKSEILTIYPLEHQPQQVTIKTHQDHRLAMAFSILLLHYPWLKLDKPEVVNKSFPGFWQEFEKYLLKI
jgi:3-phosphoshikimate 1-carboxyvinyltransferase